MTFPKLDGVRIAVSAGALLVVFIVGGLGLAFAQQLRLAQDLRAEVRQLEHAVATQEARGVCLTATLEYVQSDEYVSQWAREEAKMAKPGEVVLIPMVGAGGSEPAATPTALVKEETVLEPEKRPFWAVWLEMIFGPGGEGP